MTPPDISVLTPSYGYGRFIRDAIESVLAQTDIRVQHIIQDAASSDDTVAVLKSYGNQIDWVSEPDRGQSDALNKAVARARGRWIGWLNADEFYLPNALAYLVTAAEKKGADVVYGDAVFVDESGRFIRLVPQHKFSHFILKTYGTYISSCAMIIRRALLDDSPWDERLRMLMDRDVYLKLARQGARFAYVPCPVGAFRVHSGRITARPSSDFAADYTLIGKKYGLRGPHLQRAGRAAHAIRKLAAGSYVRQLRASRRGPIELRWFASEQNLASTTDLLHALCTEGRSL